MAIKTKIQLANDTKANWEGSSRELLNGEVAIAYTDGKAELRFGNGKTYSEAVPLQISADQVIGLNDTITSLSTTHYEVSSLTALTATSYVNGDTAVVKTQIADTDKYTYTAYVYDSIAASWKAMDGNYDAENVYFNEDFIYTAAFGVLAKPASSATLSAKGKNLEQLLKSVLAQETKPTKPTPTTTLTATSANVEVGTSISPKFNMAFDAKSYAYGSNTNTTANSTTGVVGGKYTITYNRQGTTTTLTGNFTTTQLTADAITVVEGDNTKDSKLSVSYDAATEGTYVPKTNIGNACEDRRVTAGTATATNSNKITGYYGYFYGYKAAGSTIADPAAISSAQVRTLGSGAATSFPKTIACNKMQQIFLACYKGKKSTIKVENATNGAPQTVVGPVDITVKDAAGTDRTYSLWYVDNTTPDGGEITYKITAS